MTVEVKGGVDGNGIPFQKHHYDGVFQPNSTQASIYNTGVKPIIESVMEGFNGTVFAYGQTSSGKTHTMYGYDFTDENARGMIPRMVSHLFDEIASAPQEIEFQVKVSMIEIYMEKIRDLLNPSQSDLKVREERGKGVFINK